MFQLPLLAQTKTFVVAKEVLADFQSIQAAINTMPDHSQTPLVIYIKPGVYQEKLVIPSWKTNIRFIAEANSETIIVWNDYAGKEDINTFTSYTVLVQGNDFYAEHISFENNAGRDVGQAVALHVEADRAVFKNCRILGNQDTLYTGVDNSRQYYKDCYIEGTTDFIFGPATAVFEDCIIHCKKNSYITAASTPQHHNFGYVFLNCTITASADAQKVYLGRPWRPYAKTVFINTEMGEHILPEGWHNWNKPEAELNSFYAEYNSKGKGANPEKRVTWSKQLHHKQVSAYTLDNIFKGWVPEIR